MPSAEPTLSIRELLEQEAEQEPTEPSAPTPTPEPSTTPEEQPKGAEKTEPSPLSAGEEGFSKFETQLLKGVNTSGWTDAQKREWVEARKPLVKGWHGSQAKYADALRLSEALSSAGLTMADLQEAAVRKRNGAPQPTPSPEVRKALKGIDRLIEESTDPQVKEQLRQSKAVILEEAEAVLEARLGERMKPMEEKLARLEGLAQTYSFSEAHAEVDALEDKDGYPVELIEKYRDQLVRWRMQSPNQSREQILFYVVPSSELKEFLRPSAEASSSKGKTSQKAPTVSKTGEETTEADLAPYKDKKGRISNLTGFVQAQLGKVLGG